MYLVYRQYISYTINIIGTILSAFGSLCMAIGNYKAGFLVYNFANFLLLCLFTGVWRRYWLLNSASICQVILYAIFLCFSVYGYVRVM